MIHLSCSRAGMAGPPLKVLSGCFSRLDDRRIVAGDASLKRMFVM
jgi:hypothetical protein